MQHLFVKIVKKSKIKKNGGIVRYLRTAIDTKFEYNTSKMLQGCSKKRPVMFVHAGENCYYTFAHLKR